MRLEGAQGGDLILSHPPAVAGNIRSLNLSAPERRKRSYANWSDLIAALVDGDATVAEQVARRLSLGTRDTALKMLAQR